MTNHRCYFCGTHRPPEGSSCFTCNSKSIEANWLGGGKTCRHCKGTGTRQGRACAWCVANPFRDRERLYREIPAGASTEARALAFKQLTAAMYHGKD